MLIDTHCHILKEYYDNLDEVIASMGDNIMIVCGTNPVNNQEVIDLCEKYSNIFGTIGFYPGEIDCITDSDFDTLKEQLKHPKIVGIGEIGLDYHYGRKNKEKQIEIFKRQIDLARETGLTIVIHSRDAASDTYQVLKESDAKSLRTVIHCYSYSVEMARQFTKLGIMLGIGGVVTFQEGNTMAQVVADTDLKYLVLETDSPYLTPKPYRGKKNEPKYVSIVSKKISEIKQIPEETVIKQTTLNAARQFDLHV